MHGDEIQSLDFPFEIYAAFSEPTDRIVVEKFSLGKIGFYLPCGTLDVDVDIPTVKGFEYRGINRNNDSRSGLSLLYSPADVDKGNQWRDIEQYELLKSPVCLGNLLGIYR